MANVEKGTKSRGRDGGSPWWRGGTRREARPRKWAFARPAEKARLWKKLNPSAKSPVRVAVKRTLSYVPSSKASEKKGGILVLFSRQIGTPCPPLALRPPPPSFSMALHLVKKTTRSSIINLVGLSRRRVCRINAKSIRWARFLSSLFFFLFSFWWDI